MFAKIFLTLLSISLSVVIINCDGVFPTQTKPRLPEDHTDNRGGFFHKGNRTDDVQDCRTCHGFELKGGVTFVEGKYQRTPSCYQCHGENWLNFR